MCGMWYMYGSAPLSCTQLCLGIMLMCQGWWLHEVSREGLLGWVPLATLTTQRVGRQGHGSYWNAGLNESSAHNVDLIQSPVCWCAASTAPATGKMHVSVTHACNGPMQTMLLHHGAGKRWHAPIITTHNAPCTIQLQHWGSNLKGFC